MLSSSLISVAVLVTACSAGYLPYFGEPITSAASPFIHGFANPVFHQPIFFKSFYAPPPLLKTFYAPHPIFFHQPQPHFLPFPNFLALPASQPAQAETQSDAAGGYTGPSAPPAEAEGPGGYADGPPSSGYGAPSAQSASGTGGYNGNSGPSGTGAYSGNSGPSGLAQTARGATGGYSGNSGPSGTGATGSEAIEVFQDDFQGKNSVGVDSAPEAPYQSFIANKRNEGGSKGPAQPTQGYLPPRPSNSDGGR